MSLTRRATLAALSFLAIVACASTPTPPDTTIYLVRHAEKQAGDDPDLTVVGRARADILSQELQGAGLTEIWSTNTKRTISTAKPTANSTGLPVQLYDARRQDVFANQLKATPGAMLVVGHSNTIPDLVKQLGGKPGAPIVEATEYDRLYVVTVTKGRAKSELRRYGE
ncbi:phosphoglycerate mutase family protein [Hyphomonas adhaerens MHS-3]|uniref:Phosphoglycerate mutase family protein n=1 Tax=Hyphomonas adhaerens MHS-3 TaxID=1280949 RepID=A0A069E181_9PROT|nr:phosphoglycerate mutase family protein [Hyphomonas adhaerens]KCZ83230.1 phosphoglycerate mutase family protein [Hyphomonas adhaerens MHS-3]